MTATRTGLADMGGSCGGRSGAVRASLVPCPAYPAPAASTAARTEDGVGLADRAFAAVYDAGMRSAERAGLSAHRRELLADASGHVVELGAGTGANLGSYRASELDSLTLAEPSLPMVTRLRARAAAAPAVAAEVVVAPGEALPRPDGSVDTVVSTLVLCTVRDLEATLDEVVRVLVPGGRLLLLEHVAAPADTRLHTAQRLLAGPWRTFGRGCHVTRDPRPALVARGFDTSRLAPTSLPLPAPARPGLVGAAVAPG
ncbi:class I SAM-dependent methyltransferase [Nitriliruptoraceae bacterium ZYF776]|nr:class I SAM-dependent methyltransferase [Profundirhabdus halotolerans]